MVYKQTKRRIVGERKQKKDATKTDRCGRRLSAKHGRPKHYTLSVVLYPGKMICFLETAVRQQLHTRRRYQKIVSLPPLGITLAMPTSSRHMHVDVVRTSLKKEKKNGMEEEKEGGGGGGEKTGGVKEEEEEELIYSLAD